MNRLVQSLRIRKNCDIIELFPGYFGYRERCVAADGDEFLHLVGAIVAVYLGLGFTRLDNAFLIALMPVTAYLPVIIAVFVLSKRSFTGNVFVISVALLACVIAGLVRKLVVTFGFDGVWGGVLCALIVAAVSAVIAFVVYYYLRGIFRDYDKTEKKNLFLLPVMFLPVVLSLYQISSVSDLTAILLLLAPPTCACSASRRHIS